MADTVYQQLRAHVHDLRLSAVAEQLAPALEQAEREQPSYTQFLADLLAHEVRAVEQRRLQGRLRFAKLPARRTLDQFGIFADMPAKAFAEMARRRRADERDDALRKLEELQGMLTALARSIKEA